MLRTLCLAAAGGRWRRAADGDGASTQSGMTPAEKQEALDVHNAMRRLENAANMQFQVRARLRPDSHRNGRCEVREHRRTAQQRDFDQRTDLCRNTRLRTL